jgi:hypothetical protein
MGMAGCGPDGRIISLWGTGITNPGQMNGEHLTIYQRSDLGHTNAPAAAASPSAVPRQQ